MQVNLGKRWGRFGLVVCMIGQVDGMDVIAICSGKSVSLGMDLGS